LVCLELPLPLRSNSEHHFIATTLAKKPLGNLDVEYHFVKLEKNKFFGITVVEVEGNRVRISNPEKTIVD